MRKARRSAWISLIVLVLVGGLAWRGDTLAADNPGRQTTIVVSYTEYEWWLISWESNEIACVILVDHAGLPTPEEVQKSCGQSIYFEWQNTPPCTLGSKGKERVSDCDGLYLHLVGSQPQEREVVVDLPTPTVWLNLDGCTPAPPANLCPSIPSLLFTGEEPLPNEQITGIRGTYDGIPFTCPSNVCKLPLKPTPVDGVAVEFWGESSYGDKSEIYTARVRVIDTGVPVSPGRGGWFVDVISSQWTGATIATCAGIWQAFPPIGEPPAWLSTPDQSKVLASGDPYYYLAGRLIAQGVVDASGCATGGLQPNGYADVCGLEKARPLVEDWQNQFDTRIVEVAKATGVPAQLMKNLFAQESQFWPGVFRVPFEFGLGQITEKGADSILLWNNSFYDQFCPLVLAQETCDAGYLGLSQENQLLLRGALASQANANCQDCPAGINLNNASFSVSLFANTLVANCAQVGQLVSTATQVMPGEVTTYEDLWRLTVANYHAGPGCISYAIHEAWDNSGKLDWLGVAANLTDPCKGVVPYVEKITK